MLSAEQEDFLAEAEEGPAERDHIPEPGIASKIRLWNVLEITNRYLVRNQIHALVDVFQLAFGLPLVNRHDLTSQTSSVN